MQEYFKLGHAEEVPLEEVDSSRTGVYYFPVHAFHKEDSAVHIVFDASAKTASGTSLNDHLLIGPSIHLQPTDVI